MLAHRSVELSSLGECASRKCCSVRVLYTVSEEMSLRRDLGIVSGEERGVSSVGRGWAGLVSSGVWGWPGQGLTG